jgi:hypothetical protein
MDDLAHSSFSLAANPGEVHSNRLNRDCDDSKLVVDCGRALRWRERFGSFFAERHGGWRIGASLDFLGSRELRSKTPLCSYWISLDFLGFPWILSSETSDFNGLRWIIGVRNL